MLVSANVEVNGIYYWLTGSLINRTWEHVAMLWPWVVSGLVLGLACAGRLDTMILDEDVLTALGMRVTAWRLLFGLRWCCSQLRPWLPRVQSPSLAWSHHTSSASVWVPGVFATDLLPLSALVGAGLRALLILPPNGRRCRPASYAYFWVAQCWSIWSAGGRL
ncbi:iron chelate uptake ABC transporter family permease subunit [Pseudomonas aeruginosa]|nr:iron chelate uptake ABC transporter family permease subunit [Pseudomonas aeruginosa]